MRHAVVATAEGSKSLVQAQPWHARKMTDVACYQGEIVLKRRGSKPSVKGTRLSVELILGWLGQGWTVDMLLESYPTLSRDDVLAALAFAADMLRDERYIAIHQAA